MVYAMSFLFGKNSDLNGQSCVIPLPNNVFSVLMFLVHNGIVIHLINLTT
jgi:hypothetical protein